MVTNYRYVMSNNKIINNKESEPVIKYTSTNAFIKTH